MMNLKHVILVMTLVIILIAPVNAKNNNTAIAAGIAAVGVAAIIALSSENESCTLTTYKGYTTGIKLKATLGSKLIDYKTGVCISNVLTLNKEMIDQSKIKFDSTANNNLTIKEGETSTQFIGTNQDGYAVAVIIDYSGKVLEFDDFEYMIGQTIYEKREKIIINKNTFSQKIVYTGTKDNIVYLQYREFSGDLIRSPFTQNLTIDLSKGNVVNIMNFEFEIIKADNTGIIFIIK